MSERNHETPEHLIPHIKHSKHADGSETLGRRTRPRTYDPVSPTLNNPDNIRVVRKIDIRSNSSSQESGSDEANKS